MEPERRDSVRRGERNMLEGASEVHVQMLMNSLAEVSFGGHLRWERLVGGQVSCACCHACTSWPINVVICHEPNIGC